mmetsp:Transcript_36866/g.64017  ORF Transcript_36866/g.64017 Transcript_36866/m.64017 type:complete len:101 (+) Transcript_36866:675-977(+)
MEVSTIKVGGLGKGLGKGGKSLGPSSQPSSSSMGICADCPLSAATGGASGGGGGGGGAREKSVGKNGFVAGRCRAGSGGDVAHASSRGSGILSDQYSTEK